MSIPLDKLVDTEENVYQMTCVAIKEAAIIASNPEAVEELDSRHEKIVSSVLDKVLNKEIEYTPSEE
ncbi:MAG: hypothetical protein MJ052_00850 [Sphaerochaetaceae bacterium]|nr:hypothetical protein [Sphaerochaetaceae bacterium]